MPALPISIILPVNNASRYIIHAIDCVLNQSMRDFELIIVDDGSTDKTGLICDEYAVKDSRVKVFHKPNGGVASARQLGIEQATGIYSIHFDADDYAAPEMLAEMYNTAVETDADVVIADFNVRFSEKNIVRFDQKIRSDKSSDVLIDILEGKVFGALWHKLIRTSLYRDMGICFEPGINYCEDVLVDAKFFKDDAVKVVHHNGAYYTYCRDNPESLTVNYDATKFAERLKFFQILCGLLKDDKFMHALESEAWDIKMEAYGNGLLKLKDFDRIYPDTLRFIRYARARKLIRVKLMAYNLLHRIIKITPEAERGRVA